MIARNLARRLERLEDAMLPDADPLFFQIVIVHSDGKRELGEKIGPINRGGSAQASGSRFRERPSGTQRREHRKRAATL